MILKLIPYFCRQHLYLQLIPAKDTGEECWCIGFNSHDLLNLLVPSNLL